MGAATNNPNFNQLLRGGALSPNRDGGRVNMFFLPRFNLAGLAIGVNLQWARRRGMTIPNPPGPPRNVNGVYVRTNDALDGRDLAHEFGHYMGMCFLNPPAGTPAPAGGNGKRKGQR